MSDVLAVLKQERIPYFLCSYSSLDRYFRIKGSAQMHLATESSVISLAKAFDRLEFTGLPLEDAVVQAGESRVVFHCVDSLSLPPSAPFTVLGLMYDPGRDTFLDRLGVYPHLRAEHLEAFGDQNPSWLVLCEAAKLVSRYHYGAEGIAFGWAVRSELPPASYQRELLETILSSRFPEKGLALLESAGFVEAAWPELHSMTQVPHIKDYHPEGNVWEHTLETLKYRKRLDALLSLSLLLHDIGKPTAENTGEKRFDGHSELGARVAVRFLRRLGFPEDTVDSVQYLVRYHMFPAALKRLPPFRTENVLASPLFPLLLELYRADLSSSYLDEEGYFEACRIYRSFLKDRGNPYKVEKKARQRTAAHWR